MRDNVFNIPLPGGEFVLSRYLYSKDSLVLHLISDILDKKDTAVYWGCELFNSGFKAGFFEIIWKIYYNFFATLNPSYECYLQKKQDMVLSQDSDTEKHIASIVNDLIIRDYNIDVPLLKMYNNVFEMQEKENLEKWIENEDYVSICIYVLNQKKETNLMIYEKVIDTFGKSMTVYKSKWVKDYEKRMDDNNNTMLIAKIMALFMKKRKIKEKKKYTLLSKEDVEHLTNEAYSNIKAWKVLRHARIPNKTTQCFQFLARGQKYILNEKVFKEILSNKWLYHASFSPLWFERIQQYRGYVDYANRNVYFVDEVLEEEFHQHYDYEPDEQPLGIFTHEEEVCESFENMTLNPRWFYEKYNVHGIVPLEDDIMTESLSIF